MSNLTKKRNLLKKANLKKLRAIDLLGTRPDMSYTDVCKDIDINMATLKQWRDDVLPTHQKFVKAKLQDNPHISEFYEDQLRKLDPASRERLLHGNWEYDEGKDKLFANLFAAVSLASLIVLYIMLSVISQVFMVVTSTICENKGFKA